MNLEILLSPPPRSLIDILRALRPYLAQLGPREEWHMNHIVEQLMTNSIIESRTLADIFGRTSRAAWFEDSDRVTAA